jgi:hypothetical protein
LYIQLRRRPAAAAPDSYFRSSPQHMSGGQEFILADGECGSDGKVRIVADGVRHGVPWQGAGVFDRLGLFVFWNNDLEGRGPHCLLDGELKWLRKAGRGKAQCNSENERQSCGTHDRILAAHDPGTLRFTLDYGVSPPKSVPI